MRAEEAQAGRAFARTKNSSLWQQKIIQSGLYANIELSRVLFKNTTEYVVNFASSDTHIGGEYGKFFSWFLFVSHVIYVSMDEKKVNDKRIIFESSILLHHRTYIFLHQLISVLGSCILSNCSTFMGTFKLLSCISFLKIRISIQPSLNSTSL